MPQHLVLEIDVFDTWGVAYMGPFPCFNFNCFILVVVDYLKMGRSHAFTADANTMIKIFKSIIFSWFGVSRCVISDAGNHFAERQFENLLQKYGVTNKFALPFQQ